MNKNNILNQIISIIRMHRKWNGEKWVYNNMSKDYVIFINNLCDTYEKELKIAYYHTNKDDFNYELLELELRLRGLRDKLENG